MNRLLIIVLVGIASIAIFAAGGCSMNGAPRLRTGSYATATLGTNFLDANSLGRHSYATPLLEKDGIVYTCRGGHIDIAHVRIAADYVRYLYYKTKKNLMQTNSEFSFKSNDEPSRYFVQFKYPDSWKSLSRKEMERIADEVSLEVSQYLTYTMTTWHEILTWFGYKSTGLFPEFPSAFSWEDNYSNIVGTRLGAEAMKDEEHDFDEAMTIIIKKELENLGVQSRKTAREAPEKMKGKWWDGTPFVVLVEMKERNMDLGYVDGLVTPTLVPGICEGAKPQSYPVPTLRTLVSYGFTMGFEIEPKEFEKDRILKIIYPNGKGKKIQPAVHIPIVMDYIKKEGIKMGYTVMPPKDQSKLMLLPLFTGDKKSDIAR
jgi:hypothetical protein